MSTMDLGLLFIGWLLTNSQSTLLTWTITHRTIEIAEICQNFSDSKLLLTILQISWRFQWTWHLTYTFYILNIACVSIKLNNFCPKVCIDITVSNWFPWMRASKITGRKSQKIRAADNLHLSALVYCSLCCLLHN